MVVVVRIVNEDTITSFMIGRRHPACAVAEVQPVLGARMVHSGIIDNVSVRRSHCCERWGCSPAPSPTLGAGLQLLYEGRRRGARRRGSSAC